jgi:hypothetical protein
MGKSARKLSYVAVEQDDDGRLAWSEFLEEDGADWWTLEWHDEWLDGIGYTGTTTWTCFFNGPRGWKNAGGLHLRNWEPAY